MKISIYLFSEVNHRIGCKKGDSPSRYSVVMSECFSSMKALLLFLMKVAFKYLLVKFKKLLASECEYLFS